MNYLYNDFMMENVLTDEYFRFEDLYHQNYVYDMQRLLNYKNQIEGSSVAETDQEMVFRICNFFSSFIYNTCEMLKWLYNNKGLMSSIQQDCILKDAYYYNVIDDGQTWMDMLKIAASIRQNKDVCTPKMMLECLSDSHIEAINNLNRTIGVIIQNDKQG